MIDWITCKIPFVHTELPAGRVLSLSPSGEVEWESPKALDLKGSWDTNLRFRSTGARVSSDGEPNTESFLNDELTISGNPSKWLQGHNVYGSEDLAGLVKASCDRLHSMRGTGSVSMGSILQASVSRVDFTKSLQFSNVFEVREYIRQTGMRAQTRTGRPNAKGHTLTFQPSSARWTCVVYSKGDEVFAHKLPADLPCRDRIEAEAQRLCRVELRLKGKELDKIGCKKIGSLNPAKLNELYSDYIGRINMNLETKLPNDIIMALTPVYRATYLMWASGIGVSESMTESTFYRHRTKLAEYGIDIGVPFQEVGPSVVPLQKVITAQPYQVPSWGYSDELFFKAA